MKRCPECGFRAADVVCPLCGVKMQKYTAPIKTHTHIQNGEKCALPNRGPMPATPKQPECEAYSPEQKKSRQQHRATPNFGALVVMIIVYIVYILLRSCA